MGHVRGPFIEYECPRCGTTVNSNVPRDRNKLQALIVEKNTNPAKRLCAGCWNPADDESPNPPRPADRRRP